MIEAEGYITVSDRCVCPTGHTHISLTFINHYKQLQENGCSLFATRITGMPLVRRAESEGMVEKWADQQRKSAFSRLLSFQPRQKWSLATRTCMLSLHFFLSDIPSDLSDRHVAEITASDCAS
jgi:hypothetical protein